MPINFTQIFHNSWNFVRNEKQFTLSFLVIFALTLLLVNHLTREFLAPVMDKISQADNSELESLLQQGQQSKGALSYLFNQFLVLLVSSWGIIHIHRISQRNTPNLIGSFAVVLSKLAGIVILNVLIMLPMLAAMANLLPLMLSGSGAVSIALIAVILGIFIYVRLCLAPLSYFIGNKPIMQAIPYFWRIGNKRTGTLLIYCLIVQFFLPFVSMQFSFLGQMNILLEIISILAISFINLFTLVITYRFYTLFIQNP
ncbi:hypothetical protein [Mesocricetibacter intestinalis]|uniref:hypothetical protein n=1 Tax=Mesocricetibacter intestinalis TaxID=1521930 RepID=UPI00105F0D26|nr:hypothetical protein [Mesocricetibacter intestinalis]